MIMHRLVVALAHTNFMFMSISTFSSQILIAEPSVWISIWKWCSVTHSSLRFYLNSVKGYESYNWQCMSIFSQLLSPCWVKICGGILLSNVKCMLCVSYENYRLGRSCCKCYDCIEETCISCECPALSTLFWFIRKWTSETLGKK